VVQPRRGEPVPVHHDALAEVVLQSNRGGGNAK
jgi:hypothetical protein